MNLTETTRELIEAVEDRDTDRIRALADNLVCAIEAAKSPETPEPVECFRCDGAGCVIEGDRLATCPDCKGRGEVQG